MAIWRIGIGNSRIRKIPLTFSMYGSLALSLYMMDSVEFLFTHCFLILCWNLMARASNVCEINLNHLSWEGDSMGVRFSHAKNDQIGDTSQHVRHVYANPFNAAICPILAMATYLAEYGFPSQTHSEDGKSPRLFPGTGQYWRYSKSLKSAMSQPLPCSKATKSGGGSNAIDRFKLAWLRCR